MKRLILIFLLLLPLFACTQNLDFLDAKTGFREFNFGQEYNLINEKFNQIHFAVSIGEKKFYEKSNENLQFGELTASKIQYIFLNNIFVGYSITFKGVDEYNIVSEILTGMYGIPTGGHWKGKINNCMLSMVPKNSGMGMNTMISFSNEVAWVAASQKSSKHNKSGF